MSRYVAEVWTGNPREARVGNYVPQNRTPQYVENQRQRRRNQIAKGLCTWGLCGKPHADGNVLCVEHRNRNRELNCRAYRARQRMGLCVKCGEKREPERHALCVACCKYERLAARERAKR